MNQTSIGLHYRPVTRAAIRDPRATFGAGIPSSHVRFNFSRLPEMTPSAQDARPLATKEYDAAYFERWYRNPRTRVTSDRVLERKAHLALSVAEYVLERQVRTALDVGCGEARWKTALQRLRPGLRYTGVESSEYVLRAFGARRNIRRGSFGSLATLKLRGPFDLIVCADVLQYVPDADLRR